MSYSKTAFLARSIEGLCGFQLTSVSGRWQVRWVSSNACTTHVYMIIPAFFGDIPEFFISSEGLSGQVADTMLLAMGLHGPRSEARIAKISGE